MRHIPKAAIGLITAVLIAPAARAEQPVTTFTLDNGMDVVVIEDHRAPVVTHMVWYRVGAADEPWGRSGIAHFFEHLMYRGTDDLAPGEFSRIVAENGGVGNAFTSSDYTAYFQRVAADRLGLMMSLEAERMRDLVINDDVLATERKVILEERNQRIDNDPGARFFEELQGAEYRNGPYGVPVIGWRHEIEQLNSEDAITFYKRYYAPDNAILVVAGDVTPDQVRTLAEEYYGPLQPSGKPRDARPTEPPHIAALRVLMHDPQVRQPYFERLYSVPPYDPKNPREAAALELLSQVLGGGIASMLSEQVQVAEGKAIGIGCWYSGTAIDTTSFGVWGAPPPGVGLDELEAAIDAVIARVRQDGPDPADLERARRNMLANEIYAQDDQAGVARRYGSTLATGFSVEDVQKWPDVVAAVTLDDVQKAAAAYLVPEQSVTGWLTREPVDGVGENAGKKEAG